MDLVGLVNAMENNTLPIKRKETEIGLTIRHETACTRLYITVNKNDEDTLIESFIRPSKRGGCEGNLEAVGRLISLAMRYKIPLLEIIEQLRGIRCKACTNKIAMLEDKSEMHYSCPDSIARALGKADHYFKGDKKDGKDIEKKV